MTDLPPLSTPLPTLILDVDHAWEWPRPPFARSHAMAALDGGAEPCRIETPNGAAVEGELVGFEVVERLLRFKLAAGGAPLTLPFHKFRRLTLDTPWSLVRRSPDAPVERVPTAARERGYRVDLAAGGHLSGRTMGHVNTDEGWFFFTPLDEGAAVQRVFVPTDAAAAVSFGLSAEEQAAERWIATPRELFDALEAQKRGQIKPLGQALLDLGLVTRSALDRVIAAQRPDRERPLGEELVAQGLLSRADLRTALARKMGYPLVDLSRFPVEEEAARMLPARTLREHNVFPLMRAGDQLIVAIDDLARVPRLQGLHALVGLKVVPVMASHGRIAVALAGLNQRLGSDRWGENVPLQTKGLATAPGLLGKR